MLQKYKLLLAFLFFTNEVSTGDDHIGNLFLKPGQIREIFGLSQDKEERCSPLHWAAYNGHTQIAKALIASGMEVDIKCENGYTPLHFAARKSNEEIIKFLLSVGADPLIKSSRGSTPLDFIFHIYNKKVK